MPLIDVYDTRTGRRHVIPDHWIGHPTLGRGYSIDPPSVAPATEPEPAPEAAPKAARAASSKAPVTGDTEKEE